MAAITLEVPADVVEALRFPPNRASEELAREFAAFLVKEELCRGPKRGHGGIDRVAFEDLLVRRDVAWDAAAGEVLGEVEQAGRILAS